MELTHVYRTLFINIHRKIQPLFRGKTKVLDNMYTSKDHSWGSKVGNRYKSTYNPKPLVINDHPSEINADKRTNYKGLYILYAKFI